MRLRLTAAAHGSSEPRKITAAPGKHAVVLDHACTRFVDTHDSLGQPPTITLRSLDDGALLATIFDERDPRIDELALEPPELVSLPSRDGATLHGAIFRPPARFGPGPYPTLVQVYGGPHAQTVTDSWSLTIAMRAQYLRSQGFLVFLLDNRGSARRGLAFEGAIKHTWAISKSTIRSTACAGWWRKGWPTRIGWASTAGATAATWP